MTKGATVWSGRQPDRIGVAMIAIERRYFNQFPVSQRSVSPMPGPTTEVLNHDLKGICADLRRVEATLSTEIHRVETTLTAEIHRVETTLSTALSSLAAEFNFVKWLVSAALVALLSGLVSSAYWAGSLATRVTTLEARADKTDARLDRIETTLTGILSGLDRIEVSIAKVANPSEREGSSTSEKR